MYEEFRTWETRIEVGPSAAPMMPIEAASFKSKPRSVAAKMTAKMPNCAAAPKRK